MFVAIVFLFSCVSCLYSYSSLIKDKKEERKIMSQQNSSPEALTVKAIVEWLITRGATHIIGVKLLADILGYSERTIKNDIRVNALKTIDKRTMLLSDVAKWLIENPRRMIPSSNTRKKENTI